MLLNLYLGQIKRKTTNNDFVFDKKVINHRTTKMSIMDLDCKSKNCNLRSVELPNISLEWPNNAMSGPQVMTTKYCIKF